MSQLGGLSDPWLMPGMSDPVISAENEFTWGISDFNQLKGYALDGSSLDVGNTPQTTLRRGLAVGVVAATGKLKQYNPSATDGTQNCIGFLHTARNLYNSILGTTSDRTCMVMIRGCVKVGNVYGLDEQGRRQLQDRIVFDDLRPCPGGPLQIQAKTANYTVVNGQDNNILFTTDGATAEVDFTLPAVIQRGQSWSFMNTTNQIMKVIGPTGQLICFNNAAATSVSLQTAGQLIGGGFDVFPNSGATAYIVVPQTWNGQNVTVA